LIFQKENLALEYLRLNKFFIDEVSKLKVCTIPHPLKTKMDESPVFEVKEEGENRGKIPQINRLHFPRIFWRQ